MLYYSLRRWRDANNYSALAKGLVTKDVLTQSFNRRALESKLLQEWRRFERYREPFTIILIHIDDFKDINYAFNHQEGDRVIIEVAKKLQANIRNTDACGRWSGTEFLILCPVSELEATAALAERLRADVYHLLKGGVELSIMLALGQSNNYESLEALLKGVERQLSEAKKSEGNCVISE